MCLAKSSAVALLLSIPAEPAVIQEATVSKSLSAATSACLRLLCPAFCPATMRMRSRGEQVDSSFLAGRDVAKSAAPATSSLGRLDVGLDAAAFPFGTRTNGLSSDSWESRLDMLLVDTCNAFCCSAMPLPSGRGVLRGAFEEFGGRRCSGDASVSPVDSSMQQLLPFLQHTPVNCKSVSVDMPSCSARGRRARAGAPRFFAAGRAGESSLSLSAIATGRRRTVSRRRLQAKNALAVFFARRGLMGLDCDEWSRFVKNSSRLVLIWFEKGIMGNSDAKFSENGENPLLFRKSLH